MPDTQTGATAGANGAQWTAALDEVALLLERLGGEGWLVGGCLRDALLGLPVRDVDLAVTSEPLAVARALKRVRVITIATLNRSVRIGLVDAAGPPSLQLDLSPLNGPTIADDLAQRDFRMNALGLPLAARREFVALLTQDARRPRTQPPPSLLDPVGGLDDLRGGVIVPASGHALADDPARVIRAARLAARFGFAASSSLLADARATAPALAALNGDRLRDEMNALLALPCAADGLELLAGVGALSALLPALDQENSLAHALASVRAVAAVQEGGTAFPGMEPLAALAPLGDWCAASQPDGLPRIVELRWGVLLHPTALHVLSDTGTTDGDGSGESWVRRATGRLPLTGAQRTIVAQVVQAGRWRHLLAERSPDEKELRHFVASVGNAVVDVLVAAAACNAALSVAPLEGQRFSPAVPGRARAILDIFFTDRERLIPPRVLTGDDLIRELDAEPGPKLGRLLQAVRNAQLDGTVRTREEALEFARGRCHL